MLRAWAVPGLASIALLAVACSDTAELTDGAADAGAADRSTAFDLPPAPDLAPPAHCLDGVVDKDESDRDCGGSCAPCATGAACQRDADCAEGRCLAHACVLGPRLGPPVSTVLAAGVDDLRALDLDGDLTSELVAASSAAHALFVLRRTAGAPAGHFDVRTVDLGATLGALGAAPERLASGDWNSDGKLDVAVAAGSGVAILLGNGDGTLRASRLLDFGAAVDAPVAADFDGDHHLDLAASDGSGRVLVALGAGDGTFAAPALAAQLAAPAATVTMAAADFDADRHADIAVYEMAPMGPGIELLRGMGGGVPGLAVRTPLPSLARAGVLRAFDVNGDRKADLVLAAGDLVVLLGDGQGGYAAPLDAGMLGARTLALDDLDRDGHVDVILSGGGPAVAVLRGRGDGTFEPPQATATTHAVAVVTVGDFDGDGLSDVAGAAAATQTIDVLPNRTP